MTDSDTIKGLVERDAPLATVELEALNAKWPRIVSAVYAAEARATQAEAYLSSLKEAVTAWAQVQKDSDDFDGDRRGILHALREREVALAALVGVELEPWDEG